MIESAMSEKIESDEEPHGTHTTANFGKLGARHAISDDGDSAQVL